MKAIGYIKSLPITDSYVPTTDDRLVDAEVFTFRICIGIY